ncbi:MAG: toll/interleukin-1 receptor domain-containing protein [Lachnospiraceae bacterium]|nr:toll/interleukin-1 receptor domain-containing protein [Lachnospiraceae bacterium]
MHMCYSKDNRFYGGIMKKDFFISYNKADKEWAKWIAGTLEENGYTTIIQAWDFRTGNNFVIEMQKAILNSEKIVLVLSQKYLDSEYCQAEWAAMFCCDPIGEHRKIIPVRVDDVKPEGLLATNIYVDIYGMEEEKAVKNLLNAIEHTENPRKKPIFNSVKKSKNDNVIDFCFNLGIDDEGVCIPIDTKNKLREWYYNGAKEKFKVVISDKSKIKVQREFDIIKKKIDNQEELSMKEECDYDKYRGILEKSEYECKLKEKAIEFFLKDWKFQQYITILTYIRLVDYIKKIMEYDCEKNIYNSNKYIKLDVFLEEHTIEFHNYFIIYLQKKDIIEKFAGGVNYGIINKYVIDLELDMIRDIAVDFFVFLAEEIVRYGNIKIVDNKKAMNLLEYRIGLH